MGGAHHLQIDREAVAGNGGTGRFFFLPGSPARASEIASRFQDVEVRDNPRQLQVHLGHIELQGQKIDVGAVSTGMGCPSLSIVVSELIGLGVRRMVRVGSAGSLQPGRVHIGDVVIATGAVRDEGTSDAFCPRDVPAVSHPDWVWALSQAAFELGQADHAFAGLVHSKDALYGREFPAGPQSEDNARYMRVLEKMGVLASEMESSHLFVLAAASGADRRPLSARGKGDDICKAGAVVAVIGDATQWAEPGAAGAAEGTAVDMAVRAAGLLALRERAG